MLDHRINISCYLSKYAKLKIYIIKKCNFINAAEEKCSAGPGINAAEMFERRYETDGEENGKIVEEKMRNEK